MRDQIDTGYARFSRTGRPLSTGSKFGVARDLLVWRLASLYPDSKTMDPIHPDYLGFFLLTILLLEELERRRSARPAVDHDQKGQLAPDDRRRLRDDLVENDAVCMALKELYHPGADTEEAKTWEDVDFSSLTFHSSCSPRVEGCCRWSVVRAGTAPARTRVAVTGKPA